MDEVKFRRIRQIILDSTTFITRGVSFDTQKVHDKGYSDTEIADAEYLLTKTSFFTCDFWEEIKQIATNNDEEFDIFFVEFAKILFVVYEDSQKSLHFFEEELQKMVLLKQYLGFCDNFLKGKAST